MLELKTSPVIEPADNAGGAYRYRLYGMRVLSDVLLRLPEETETWHDQPDLRFQVAKVEDQVVPRGQVVSEVRCDCQHHQGSVVTRVTEEHGQSWLWNLAVGTFRVSADGREVVAYPEFSVNDEAITHLFVSQVCVFVLRKRRYPLLHASAIVTPHGAVGFLGRHGAGKSTLTAAFLQAGGTLLTDDVLPLQSVDGDVYGVPGPPQMKLWDQAVEHTVGGASDLPNVLAAIPKKLFSLDERYNHADRPARVRAIYLLNRYDPAVSGATEISIERIGRREAIPLLLANVPPSAFMQPRDVASVFPTLSRLVTQAIVARLSFPNGFAHQEALCERILMDLAAQ